eukprot:364412-Chlamydomonas_euryale.AAC.4
MLGWGDSCAYRGQAWAFKSQRSLNSSKETLAEGLLVCSKFGRAGAACGLCGDAALVLGGDAALGLGGEAALGLGSDAALGDGLYSPFPPFPALVLQRQDMLIPAHVCAGGFKRVGAARISCDDRCAGQWPCNRDGVGQEGRGGEAHTAAAGDCGPPAPRCEEAVGDQA